MNKTKNILGVLGMLIVALVIGYLLFTAKEMGV